MGNENYLPPPPDQKVSGRTWLAVLAGLLGAFMAVLDIAITNSSLKATQGALSATLEEGSWISTSYLVAEIIMIPLSGFLGRALSTRDLFAIAAGGFTITSIGCASSSSTARTTRRFARRRS